MRVTFEIREPDDAWGGVQPKFESLVCEGPDEFFLTYSSASGEQGRVQLVGPGRFRFGPAEPPER